MPDNIKIANSNLRQLPNKQPKLLINAKKPDDAPQHKLSKPIMDPRIHPLINEANIETSKKTTIRKKQVIVKIKQIRH